MLRIVFLIFALYYSLLSAEDTLLNKQLEAINRQLNAERIQAGEIDPAGEEVYDYNQNAVRAEQPPRSERFYVGMNAFLGKFNTKSSDETYNIKHSTAFSYFKLGYIFKTGNRIEATYIHEADLSYGDVEDNFSGLNLNIILPTPINKEKTVYLKFQGGIGIYDYSKFGLEGISLNPAVGAIFDVTDNIELDISYLYQFIYWRDLGSISSNSHINSTTLRGLNVGFKYKF